MKTILYRWIHRKQSELKGGVGLRGGRIWMGDAPKLLEAKDLRPGDVLFCGPLDDSEKLAELIQNTTFGVYVHCGLYIGGGNIVDAVGSGVRKIPLKHFIKKYSYAAVARCPGVDKKNAKIVVAFARRCVGMRYNTTGALLVPLKEYINTKRAYSRFGLRRRLFGGLGRKKRTSSSYFCSEFVAQCYFECGYLSDEVGNHKAKYWSPVGLAESGIFELLGYMSTGGLAAVDAGDCFLSGNTWVLTDQGRRSLQERKKRVAEQVAEIMKNSPHF